MANCLIEAWRECKDGLDAARIDMKELYRRVSRLGTTVAVVRVELKAMARDGLVVLRHEAVYCGIQKSTANGGTSAATTSGGTPDTEAAAPIGTWRNRTRRRLRRASQGYGGMYGGCWWNSLTSVRTRW